MSRVELSYLESLREQINALIKNGKFVESRYLLLELKHVLHEIMNGQWGNGIVGIDIKKADLEYYKDWANDVAIDRYTRIQSDLQLSQFEADITNYI